MVKGWVEEIESEVIGFLSGHEPTSLQELAAAMRISESLALSYISTLVRDGKVTIGGLGIRGDSFHNSFREPLCPTKEQPVSQAIGNDVHSALCRKKA